MKIRTLAIGSAFALALSTALAANTGNAVTGNGQGNGARPEGQQGGGSAEDFRDKKAMAQSMVLKRQTNLQQAANCINAATNHDQLRACRDQEHAANDALHQQMQAMHPGPGKSGQGNPGQGRPSGNPSGKVAG